MVFKKRPGVCMAALLACFLMLFEGMWTSTAYARGRHWGLGDTVTREIHGKLYRFRCIDQNYFDRMEYHRPGALFLCDEVIPANTDSQYEFVSPENIPHDYEFTPGPIVNFGDSEEYKYSAIRTWLKQAERGFADAEPVNVGTALAYTGSTEAGAYEKLQWSAIKGSFIGSQKMADRLFILSVDEACRYREWLWRFNGADKNNPDSQYGDFCKGYWLRNRAGSGESGMVYAVDLVLGNIRPVYIAPVRNVNDSDMELAVTGTVGVRPAFVLPQN